MSEYFLDTNIFMYAAGKPHEFKEPCISILSKVQSGELNAAIDTEVFQEILYRYHHINLSDKGVDLAWSMMDIGFDVLPVTKKVVEVSLYFYQQYQNKGISPRDIIHVATMMQNDIKKIVSVDRHFDIIEEVQRIDPSRLR
ncbi:MAG: type II toxin-antitoxin system VapC family toxin [Methanosarcinales archaeon]|nr:type II toxin-antitoxin system VapC family toxin [Methanosarcinales archaeon]